MTRMHDLAHFGQQPGPGLRSPVTLIVYDDRGLLEVDDVMPRDQPAPAVIVGWSRGGRPLLPVLGRCGRPLIRGRISLDAPRAWVSVVEQHLGMVKGPIAMVCAARDLPRIWPHLTRVDALRLVGIEPPTGLWLWSPGRPLVSPALVEPR